MSVMVWSASLAHRGGVLFTHSEARENDEQQRPSRGPPYFLPVKTDNFVFQNKSICINLYYSMWSLNTFYFDILLGTEASQ